MPPHGEVSVDSPRAKPEERSLALDAFRGLTVALMLLVNNISLDTATPEQLMHAPWGQGIRLADVVFPWFLLCVGLSIPFSFRSASRRDSSGRIFTIRIIKRTVFLFAIGVLIQSLIHHQIWISMDVLQLIALSYAAGCVIYRRDIRLLALFIVLGLYGLVLRHAPWPGANQPFDQVHNCIAWFNHTFLSPWKFDGLLSVIPGSILVAIGTRAETVMSSPLRLLQVGFLLSLGGVLLSFDLNFSKQFWTPSYILTCGGIGLVILGCLLKLEPNRIAKKVMIPLVIFGSNPLAVYVIPILVKLTVLTWIVVPFQGKLTPLTDAMLLVLVENLGRIVGGWTYTIAYVLIVFVIAYALQRRGTLIRA